MDTQFVQIREIRVFNYLSRRAKADQLRKGAWLPRSFTLSTLQLLSHFLKLLTDYRTVETIDGDVKPIAFFAFHHEVSKTCGIGFVVACLRDHVDEQTPRPRLCELGEYPRNAVFGVLSGIRGVEGSYSCVHYAPQAG